MRKLNVAWLGVMLMAGNALATEPPRTVGDFSNAMTGIAERLDRQVADRQSAADSAAAQRLALVSAMIRRLSAEWRSAEQEAIVDAADTLPKSVKSRLDDAFARVSEAERRAGPEPGFVDEAQASFNALIDALPVITPHPTFYGLLAADLTQGLAADVVVYGHRLIDPLYGEAPSVQFGGADLPASALRTTSDRIEILLPAAVKAAVGFAPPPCEQRPSFGLRFHDVYAKARGFWPLIWHTKVDTNADLYALASPLRFEARIEASAQTPTTLAETQTFRARSEYAVVDCEQSRTVQVEVAAPEGASDIVCKAAWTDAAGQAATSGKCTRRDGVLSATGVLTGSGKVCSPDKLCACPALSQGVLEISGSYRVARIASDLTPVADLAPLAFPAGRLARRPLAVERLRRLKLEISRQACPVVAETMEINLGAIASGASVSKSGAFRATFADGVLSVGSSEAFVRE